MNRTDKRSSNNQQRVYSNLFIASISFKDPVRASAFGTLYSLMQMVDELTEQSFLTGADMKQLKAEINRLKNQVKFCYSNVQDSSQLNLAVLNAISRFQIPEQIWIDFFEAMGREIESQGYKTMGDLLDYSKGAAAVPLTVFFIIGFAKPGADGIYILSELNKLLSWGNRIGQWSFLLHILAVAKDKLVNANPPRNLIPLDLLEKYQITPEALFAMAGQSYADKNFRKCVQEIINTAWRVGRGALAEIKAECNLLSRDCANALLTPLAIYSQISRKIEERNYDIFDEPILWQPSDRSQVLSRIENCSSIDELKNMI